MSKLKASDFKPARDWIDKLPPKRLARAKKNAATLIEAIRLAEVRRALEVTQADLADRTGLKQGEVSRIENELPNIQLKTLERYMRGLGGTVTIVADFPDGARAEIPVRGGKPVKSKAIVRAG
ncbi:MULTISPECIES: helix-turn-helix transcriptional regulator [unclassified Devosia]|uniref:helix-turn-helix domain-containing protein n=1 Tax=unclassified Devosia TaxID=196773 RepID=UPI001AC126BC|nr:MULTISPECIES: helix-turn-helix transcriptional regulator [unclassified Devosia]MBN9307082.1 helix-turn-helix transcriptional regulator [Devosia sp.]